MSLRSVEQYISSLRDGRRVYFRGERVADVTTHPVIGVAVRHAAIDYALADDARYRDLVRGQQRRRRVLALLRAAAHV